MSCRPQVVLTLLTKEFSTSIEEPSRSEIAMFARLKLILQSWSENNLEEESDSELESDFGTDGSDVSL